MTLGREAGVSDSRIGEGWGYPRTLESISQCCGGRREARVLERSGPGSEVVMWVNTCGKPPNRRHALRHAFKKMVSFLGMK